MIPPSGSRCVGMHFDVAGVDHQPLKIRLFDELFEQFLPDPFVPPANETAMGIAPMTQIQRQIPPGSSGAQDPEHGIDELAVVFGVASPGTRSSGQMRFKQVPGSLSNVMAAVDRLHANNLSRFLSRDYTI